MHVRESKQPEGCLSSWQNKNSKKLHDVCLMMFVTNMRFCD